MPKRNENTQPVVTRLNLPISEESLMVDLPDGQKLVIGKMATGSVIEVATWRGTGRPDSRTNRMMLGMSGGGDATVGEGASVAASGEQAQNDPKDYVGKIVGILKSQFVAKDKAPKAPKAAKEPRAPRFSFVKMPDFKSESSIPEVPALDSIKVSSTDFDIDSWLNEISGRDKKAAPAKPAARKSSTSTPTSKTSKSAGTATPKKAPQKTATKASKGRGR